MMVKICGITNLEDARAAVASGAGAIGLNFWPRSPRYVPVDRARDLAAAIPSSVLKVGVFVDEEPARVKEVAEEAGLDVAQLHGSEAADGLPRSIRIWKAFRIANGWSADILDTYSAAEAFLLDGASPGTGAAFDWSIAGGIRKRIIIAGGLDAANVGEAIRRLRPWGVDACSQIESAPGKKDHKKMRRFISAALAEAL